MIFLSLSLSSDLSNTTCLSVFQMLTGFQSAHLSREISVFPLSTSKLSLTILLCLFFSCQNTCISTQHHINTDMLLMPYLSLSHCLSVVSLCNPDDFKSELREQLPLIAGSAAAGVVFIVSLIAISIVCSR